MTGRPITNISRKAERLYTEAILSGKVKPYRSKRPVSSPKTSWKDQKEYVPARDNPQHNVRPGADDHLQYASKGAEAQAVYHDRGHV